MVNNDTIKVYIYTSAMQNTGFQLTQSCVKIVLTLILFKKNKKTKQQHEFEPKTKITKPLRNWKQRKSLKIAVILMIKDIRSMKKVIFI